MAKRNTSEFFVYDIINYDTTDIMAMLDKLTRVSDTRRLTPLSRHQNLIYAHRVVPDAYKLQIGDVFFVIPPEFINLTSESTVESVTVLRQENSIKERPGYHKRVLTIDVVFHGLNQINGYPVPGPQGTYYVDGLRQLLAQFKCTPILPIINDVVNGTYGIFAVALQSIVVQTMQGFPDCMKANLVLQEIDMFPYLETHSSLYQEMIDWDLFRFYYQRFITESHEYKKLQSISNNNTSLKISVLDDSVFDAIDNGLATTIDVFLDKYIAIPGAKSNYITKLDSNTGNFAVTGFQYGYTNLLTNIQLADCNSPTVQFMGGMDTIYNITIQTTDIAVVQALEACRVSDDMLSRNHQKYAGLGFVKIDSELVELTGSKFVMVEYVTTSTVPGFPGLYNIQIQCVSHDVYQSEREGIQGFLPFQCEGGQCGEYTVVKYKNGSPIYGFESDHVHNGKDGKHVDQTIQQTLGGLYTKIKQDCYAEWKIRKDIELYPDLHLPTYAEVNKFITDCRNFRTKNGLPNLSYTSYPTRPECMVQGMPPLNSMSFKQKDNFSSLGYNYAANIKNSSNSYNGYVDPDFYVFYPLTYLSFDESEYTSSGVEFAKDRSAINKTVTYTEHATPETSSWNSSLIEQFVDILYNQLGCSYEMVNDADGRKTDPVTGRYIFDCSGLMTYGLRKIGLMSYTRDRMTVASIANGYYGDILKEVPYGQRQRGDLIVHYVPGGAHHVMCCLGDGQIIHATPPQVTVGKEYVSPDVARVFRPIKFEQAESAPKVNNSSFAVTDSFVDMVAQWEGFYSVATPQDGGIDIGYGFHNQYWDGSKNVKITSGMTMTQSEAKTILKAELTKTMQETIKIITNSGWDVSQFTNNQVLALTSYFYNRGLYNENAKAILAQSNSANIQAIGYNLPAYWGSATYAKQGLINRRNKEMVLFFTSDSANNTTLQNIANDGTTKTLTIEEEQSIVKTIAPIIEGVRNPQVVIKCLVQMIYDQLEGEYHGGLGSILQNTGLFPYGQAESVSQDVAKTIGKEIENVFCNGERQWSDYQLTTYLAPGSSLSSFECNDMYYDRVPDVSTFSFWGKHTPSSTTKYTIGRANNIDNVVPSTGTSDTSSSDQTRQRQYTNTVSKASYKRFAEPVFINTDAMRYDENSFWLGLGDAAAGDKRAKMSTKLNSTDVIFATSFVDEAQYSCRGRLVKAFPTYLLCVLDEKFQWFKGDKLWTNFYINRSAVDIQVHHSDETPISTATIVISDIYGSLDKKQTGLSHYTTKQEAEEAGKWNKFWYNLTHQNWDFGSPNLTDMKIRMHQVIYNQAKLKAGSRIHLRVGYGSDPLSLIPMLNGTVTDVTVGNQISIVACSDGVELTQHIISSKPNDTNSGKLGLFGLGEDQEATNIICGILSKRQSWWNHVFTSAFEGSAYSIEHFGLYINKAVAASLAGAGKQKEEEVEYTGPFAGIQKWWNNVTSSITEGFNKLVSTFESLSLGGKILAGVGAAVAAVAVIAGAFLAPTVTFAAAGGAILTTVVDTLLQSGLSISDLWNGYQEQYDLLKNIYLANYKAEHYIYGCSFLGFDGEENIVFNQFNMTPWDVFQMCTQNSPEYICKPSMHQFDSRLYFGIPLWMEKTRYVMIGKSSLSDAVGEIYEECKASCQVHFIESLTNIIDNQVRCTNRYTDTNKNVIYISGKSASTTKTLYSDHTIDTSKQKTGILDTSVAQDYFGPDKVWEYLGIKTGYNAAKRVGVSNLLIGWEQQYQGELICLGTPMNAHDYIMLFDSHVGMFGMCKAREIIHSFGINTGFITSVTPGLIGFSTANDSGLPVMMQNYLALLQNFSTLLVHRLELRRAAENNFELICTNAVLEEQAWSLMEFDAAYEEVYAKHQGDMIIAGSLEPFREAIAITKTAYNIYLGGKFIKTSYTFVRNGYKMFQYGRDAAKVVGLTADAIKAVDAITDSLKAFKYIKLAGGYGRATVNLVKSVKAGAAAATAASAPTVIGLVVMLVVDVVLELLGILLDNIIEYYENRNVCMLLPLWWNDTPFVSNVAGGTKILPFSEDTDFDY